MAIHFAVNSSHIAKAASVPAKRTTSKKTAAAKQEVLFEKDLPPLTATVAQTFSGDFFMTMIGVAAILAAAAVYVVRRSGISI